MVQRVKEERLAVLPSLHSQPSRHRDLSQDCCQICESAEDSSRHANHLFVTRRKMEKTTVIFQANSSAEHLHRFQLLQAVFIRTTVPEQESYLIHTSIGKEQRGVIQGDCRRRVHICMLVFLEEVNKPLPDLASC